MGSFDFGLGEERDKDILLEINKLKDRFEELNSNFTAQEKSMDKFSISIDKLNESFQKLTSVFERAEQMMKTDDTNSEIKTLLKQNKEVAHGIIGVGELIKQQQKDMLSLRELAEKKLSEIKSQPAIQHEDFTKEPVMQEEPKTFTPPPLANSKPEITQEPGYIETPGKINEKIQAEFDATEPKNAPSLPEMPKNPKTNPSAPEFPPATEFVSDDDKSDSNPDIPPPPQSKTLFKFTK